MPGKVRYIINIGDRFNRLLVIEGPVWGNGDRSFKCRCDCGNETVVRANALRTGHTKSCGCYLRERIAERSRKHGDAPKGAIKRVYREWRGIIARCHNPKHDGYAAYGAKGICVCDEWRTSYDAFRGWALSHGYDDSLEIDRIDPAGNYEPSNCRWVTQLENARNKRSNVIISAFGESKCVAEWVTDKRCVVDDGTLRGRLKLGWDAERAITTGPQDRYRPTHYRSGRAEQAGHLLGTKAPRRGGF